MAHQVKILAAKPGGPQKASLRLLITCYTKPKSLVSSARHSSSSLEPPAPSSSPSCYSDMPTSLIKRCSPVSTQGAPLSSVSPVFSLIHHQTHWPSVSLPMHEVQIYPRAFALAVPSAWMNVSRLAMCISEAEDLEGPRW